MPQLDSSMLWDSHQFCSNNVRQALEVLLASRNAFLVQFSYFEEAEQSFNGSRRVRVWPRVNDWDLHSVQVIPDLVASMIRSIIYENHRALLPASHLLVKMLDQPLHKQHKSILVSIRMTESKVNSSLESKEVIIASEG